MGGGGGGRRWAAVDSDQIGVRERREGRQCEGEKGARGGVRDVGETGDVRAVGSRSIRR